MTSSYVHGDTWGCRSDSAGGASEQSVHHEHSQFSVCQCAVFLHRFNRHVFAIARHITLHWHIHVCDNHLDYLCPKLFYQWLGFCLFDFLKVIRPVMTMFIKCTYACVSVYGLASVVKIYTYFSHCSYLKGNIYHTFIETGNSFDDPRTFLLKIYHYNGVIMTTMASQITSLTRLFTQPFIETQIKETSKLRVTGLCVGNSPGPVNSPHKGPVTRKMFPFDDVIMPITPHTCNYKRKLYLIASILPQTSLS